MHSPRKQEVKERKLRLEYFIIMALVSVPFNWVEYDDKYLLQQLPDAEGIMFDFITKSRQ